MAEASVEPHKTQFQKAYHDRYTELLRERKNLSEVAEQI